MRALLISEEGISYRDDYPDPEPCEDEALIRVRYAGICRTDLELIKGYMGFKGIPGHEFVGIVSDCKDRELIGSRVVGEINIPCNRCNICREGLKNHCPERTVLGILGRDGVFAEYVTLPVSNLHRLPESVTDEEGVFVEPLAAAFEILKQVEISSSEDVCVLGDGRLGILVGMVLSTAGFNPVVIGKHRKKLSILDALGIETRIHPVNMESEFDTVVDCTGSRDGIELSLRLVKPCGRIVMKTTVTDERTIDLNRLVIDEITIIGSRCGPFREAIDSLEKKRIDPIPLISKTFDLKDGVKAFNHASKRDVLKVIIRI